MYETVGEPRISRFGLLSNPFLCRMTSLTKRCRGQFGPFDRVTANINDKPLVIAQAGLR